MKVLVFEATALGCALVFLVGCSFRPDGWPTFPSPTPGPTLASPAAEVPELTIQTLNCEAVGKSGRPLVVGARVRYGAGCNVEADLEFQVDNAERRVWVRARPFDRRSTQACLAEIVISTASITFETLGTYRFIATNSTDATEASCSVTIEP